MVDDYICRKNMLNAVEQLDIIPSVDGMGIPTGAEDFRVQFLGTVLKVEPADVVPVVRCRDCKHWKEDGNYSYCSVHDDYIMGADEFCSYGERKE